MFPFDLPYQPGNYWYIEAILVYSCIYSNHEIVTMVTCNLTGDWMSLMSSSGACGAVLFCVSVKAGCVIIVTTQLSR